MVGELSAFMREGRVHVQHLWGRLKRMTANVTTGRAQRTGGVSWVRIPFCLGSGALRQCSRARDSLPPIHWTKSRGCRWELSYNPSCQAVWLPTLGLGLE